MRKRFAARARSRLAVAMLFFSALCGAGGLASAADLFMVIGQSRARIEQPPTSVFMPTEGASAPRRPGSSAVIEAHGIAGDTNCGQACDLTAARYGSLPAFALTWQALTGQSANYVIHRDLAPSAIASALSGVETALAGEPIGRRYVLAFQNRASPADVSALSGLTGVDAVFMVNTAEFPGAQSEALAAAIAAAQENSNVVLVSQLSRVLLSACTAGVGTPGCESKDLTYVTTSAQDVLGAEMARNAYVYASRGIKPLMPSNCEVAPETCVGSRDVYGWAVPTVGGQGASAVRRFVLSSNRQAFDHDASYQFRGVRFQLHTGPAEGRVAVLSLATPNGSVERVVELAQLPLPAASGQLLGYCSAQPGANANTRLVRMKNGDQQITTRHAAEVAVLMADGYVVDAVLCYVS